MVLDVIVIGAGPAGATAGEQIARAGYDVVILEKSLAPGKDKMCGGAVSKKCFLDLKLSEEIIEKECSRYVVHIKGQEINVPNKPGFVLFDRENLDQFLIQRAAENGAQLLTSTLASDVARCENGLTVRYKKPSKKGIQEAHARAIVFADGTSTLAYKKFQIGFDGKPEGTALAAAYDLRYPDNGLDSLDFFFSEEISPFGYGWIFPKKDSVNVGVTCLLSKMKYDLRLCLDRFVSSVGLASKEIVRFGSRLMPQSYTRRLHGDCVLVAGDAAGTADPIDGGGIFNAMVTGELAGRVAVEALQAENLTNSFLGRYEDLWRETTNYELFQRSYLLQRLALKADLSLGGFLERMGFFEQSDTDK